MNDFTQEELILLGCWSANRYEAVGSEQSADEGTVALSHKIQEMIVNYCDHEWINGTYCEKCNRSPTE
jgi:hypothetical protein